MADVALEKHYTVKEVAELWGVSDDKVRAMFQDDPAVLKFGRPETRFKRAYINMRIPESAIVRVHRQLREQ